MTRNEELKEIMESLGRDTSISQGNPDLMWLADITESSFNAARSWLASSDAAMYRNIPKAKLDLLKSRL